MAPNYFLHDGWKGIIFNSQHLYHWPERVRARDDNFFLTQRALTSTNPNPLRQGGEEGTSFDSTV